MKKFNSMLIVVFLAVGSIFTSCDKDDDKTAESIVGTWMFKNTTSVVTLAGKPEQPEDATDETDKGSTMTFNADGTVVTKYIYEGEEDIFNEFYKIEGTKIIIAYTKADLEVKEEYDEYDFSISNGTLALSETENFLNGETKTYTTYYTRK